MGILSANRDNLEITAMELRAQEDVDLEPKLWKKLHLINIREVVFIARD